MELPTPQQVQQAQEVLAATGLPVETTRSHANAVAMKLPALWPDNPKKWFLHCDGRFRIHRITAQQRMFDHCINAMSAEQSDVVMDLLERGPTPTCYDDLKRAYIERRTPTTAERIQRLRKMGPLADQRPSALLRIMERILGRSIDGDEIAKEEFVRRLPAQTQLIVRSQADLFTVEQLAQMADQCTRDARDVTELRDHTRGIFPGERGRVAIFPPSTAVKAYDQKRHNRGGSG